MSSGSFSEGSSSLLLSSRRVANTVFLFMTHSPSDRIAHTFFCCEIPTNLPNDEVDFKDDLEAERLKPILEFPSSEFPNFMTCTQLGSCFYFLGGRLLQMGTNVEQIYPSNVYMFDATTITNTTSTHPTPLECGMRSGKPRACTFVADGKLYVLCAFQNIIGLDIDYKSIQLFEVYNPETGKWRNLKDPPVEKPLHWRIPSFERVSESGDSPYYPYTRKVALIGRPADSRCTIVLEFNLDTEECTPMRRMIPYLPLGLIMGDTVYHLGVRGIKYYQPKKTKILPNHPWMMGEELFTLPGDPCFCGLQNAFCHLGDMHFCYVSTELVGRRCYGGTHLFIRMGVIRVVQEQDSSRSELLYSAKFDYEVEFSWFNNRFPFIDCYGLYLDKES
ncbi:uncharacterized protein LOC110705234 [Chenopodium quinoa]|uniref:uncharacterized protein LOC110705234 n=1 Tax=Chenopodium quinoa TaxID=63459 RepID=UPI000B76EBE3|nr:uncharacterized protein LOC110705234 [Chenopodium quinoa]XP_021738784.1 uncharacterized protein LOC110705234 [Chenopodium quinoa]